MQEKEVLLMAVPSLQPPSWIFETGPSNALVKLDCLASAPQGFSPHCWDYKQVTPPPAFLHELWGQNEYSCSCMAGTLPTKLPSQPQSMGFKEEDGSTTLLLLSRASSTCVVHPDDGTFITG